MNIPSLAVLMSQPHTDTHVVAISATETLDWAQFRTDVSVLTQTLQHSEHQRWALCFEDSYFFAVAFLAAAHAGRHLILPGNHQPAALAELAPHYDAILHDGIVNMADDAWRIVWHQGWASGRLLGMRILSNQRQTQIALRRSPCRRYH